MSKYLRFVFQLMEPVRVSDSSASIGGQVETLKYIPGSSIRGFVINSFADRTDFDSIKAELFNPERCYLNAYLTEKDHTLIPSPKGFYEDKSLVEKGKAKNIQNVVINGDFSDGMKRAGLGCCCFFENGCIHYYSVETGSDLRIKINAEDRDVQSVFRNDYISANQCFEGYIKLCDKPIDKDICELFKNGRLIRLGNGRSSSLGKCKVILSELTDSIPYYDRFFDAPNECYMMLLSDTVMRSDEGEYCGLNFTELSKLLWVDDLKVSFASTTTRNVLGYNRTWGTSVPSIKVYEAGSVFHLTYKGTITSEIMEVASNAGIGVRRTEGFGRMLFLRDYEKISSKLPEEYVYTSLANGDNDARISKNDAKTLNAVASVYYRHLLDDAICEYVVSHSLNKNGIKNSQLGQVEAILEKFRYDPSAAYTNIMEYFEHANEKEKNKNVQKSTASGQMFRKQIISILDKPIEETVFSDGTAPLKVQGKVMGIPVKDIFSKEDNDLYKLQLIIEMIRFDRKGE